MFTVWSLVDHNSYNITLFFFIRKHPQCTNIMETHTFLQNELVLEARTPHQCCYPVWKVWDWTKKSQFSSNKLRPAASYTQRNAPTFHCVKLHEKNVLCLPSTCAAVTNCGRFPKLCQTNCDFDGADQSQSRCREQLCSCTAQDAAKLSEGTLTAHANGGAVKGCAFSPVKASR